MAAFVEEGPETAAKRRGTVDRRRVNPEHARTHTRRLSQHVIQRERRPTNKCTTHRDLSTRRRGRSDRHSTDGQRSRSEQEGTTKRQGQCSPGELVSAGSASEAADLPSPQRARRNHARTATTKRPNLRQHRNTPARNALRTWSEKHRWPLPRDTLNFVRRRDHSPCRSQQR